MEINRGQKSVQWRRAQNIPAACADGRPALPAAGPATKDDGQAASLLPTAHPSTPWDLFPLLNRLDSLRPGTRAGGEKRYLKGVVGTKQQRWSLRRVRNVSCANKIPGSGVCMFVCILRVGCVPRAGTAAQQWYQLGSFLPCAPAAVFMLMALRCCSTFRTCVCISDRKKMKGEGDSFSLKRAAHISLAELCHLDTQSCTEI